MDRIYIAWMEWHCDHWLDLRKIYIYHTVIISNCCRIHLFICAGTSMDFIELFDLVICSPNRRQARSLRCHYINTNTIICRQFRNTRTYKFHHFILNITVIEYCTDNSKCYVLRADARHWLAIQINTDHTRHWNIVRTL